MADIDQERRARGVRLPPLRAGHAEFARAGRAGGARVVLFTDPWLSPLADIAVPLLQQYVYVYVWCLVKIT